MTFDGTMVDAYLLHFLSDACCLEGALDRGELQDAIQADRFGLDSTSQTKLSALSHRRAKLPSAIEIYGQGSFSEGWLAQSTK